MKKMETENGNRKARREVREIRKPYVMKDGRGYLVVIYKDRVEEYKLVRTDTKVEMDKESPFDCYDYEDIYGKGWNKEHEAKMLRGNGFRHIQLKDEVV
jgi:hypothetical protein